MKVIIYSEKGYKKAICEDAALLNEHIISDSFSETQINSKALVAIADGVGGNAGGELASRYVLKQFDKIDIEDITAEKLHQFIENCNVGLLEYAKQFPGKENMATTLTGIILLPDTCFIFHIGNTRVYGLQGSYLKQFTKDQTTYQWLRDRGQIEEADICNKNEITYCLGGGNLKYAAGICVNEYSLLNQCKRILLTSDGIHEYVSTDELEDFILDDINKETMQKIADKARDNGSEDDKTIVVIDRM